MEFSVGLYDAKIRGAALYQPIVTHNGSSELPDTIATYDKGIGGFSDKHWELSIYDPDTQTMVSV